MELYLRWLDRYERAEGENTPIGLILCASSNREQVELMGLDAAGIRVAEYLTHIPDLARLQTELHCAVLLARERAHEGSLPHVNPIDGEQT